MSNKLLEACEEFIRKVDCGEARSKRSYKQMKEAITEHYHAEALSKNDSIKKQLEDRNIKCINITFAPEVYGNGSIDKDKLTIQVCDLMQSYLDGKFTKVDMNQEIFTKDYVNEIDVWSTNPEFIEKLRIKLLENSK